MKETQISHIDPKYTCKKQRFAQLKITVTTYERTVNHEFNSVNQNVKNLLTTNLLTSFTAKHRLGEHNKH